MFRSCWLIRIQTVNVSHKLLKILLKKKIWSEFNSAWVTWEMLKLHHFAEYMRILANIFQEIQNCELKCLRIISYSNLWIMSHIYRSLFWGLRNPFWTHNLKWPKYWKSLKMFLNGSISQQFFFHKLPIKVNSRPVIVYYIFSRNYFEFYFERQK